MYRKHYTSFTAVKHTFLLPCLIFLHDGQTRFFKKFQLVAFQQCSLCKSIPLIIAIAKLERFDGFFAKPAFLKIGTTDRLSKFCISEVIMKILLSKLRDYIHTLSLVGFFF